jgi:insulysin
MKYLLSFFLFLISIGFASYTVIEDQNRLTIQTPSLLDITTRKIELSNGIKIYIVSDPKATQSAVAIGVNAGKFHDPVAYPGTAHFLEHMVLIASKKYPKENEIQMYIDENGGTHNAWTSFDYTMYGGSINHDAFLGLLDRFAALFTYPLLSESATRREFKAVDNEFTNYCTSDGRRFWRMMEETSEPLHPMNKFGTGNSETLSQIPLETLRKWFEDHYGSQNMVICLYSNASLDYLSLASADIFSSIPQRKKTTNHFAPFMSQFQKGQMIEMESVQDIRTLVYAWEIPVKETSHNDYYMAAMIASSLSCRTKGSLFDTLTKENLASNVGCNVSAISQDNVLFFIDIDLTESGMTMSDKVTERVFQYINTYKTKPFPYHYYKERKSMQDIAYAFQSRPSDYFQTLMQMGSELLKENIETYPQDTNSIKEYDAKVIGEVLKTLTPDNCATFCMAKRGPSYKYQHTETYIHIPYSIKPLSKKRLTYLSSLPALDTDVFPKENPYMPSELKLTERSPLYVESRAPSLLVSDDKGQLYYEQDNTFFVPEIAYKLGIKTPLIDGSTKSKALFDLFLMGLAEKLSDQKTYAANAGLSYSLSENKETVIFDFFGYSEKMAPFVENTLASIKAVQFSQADFDKYKKQTKLDYQNSVDVIPYKLGQEAMMSLCYNDRPTDMEKLKALEKIHLADLNRFAAELFQKAYFKGFISGNITDENAQILFKMTEQTLGSKTYPLSKHNFSKLAKLSPNKSPTVIDLKSGQLGFSAILLIQGDSYSPQKFASQLVLNTVLGSDFFNELRTKQQTGYIAHTSQRMWNQTMHQIFIVQSATHHPSELLPRFELYLENFVRDFTLQIPEERFNHLKESVISELSQPDNNLSERVEREFTYAFEYQADFDRKAKICAALEALDYETFREDSAALLSRQNKKRLAVRTVGIPPKGEGDFNYKDSSYEIVAGEIEFSTEACL